MAALHPMAAPEWADWQGQEATPEAWAAWQAAQAGWGDPSHPYGYHQGYEYLQWSSEAPPPPPPPGSEAPAAKRARLDADQRALYLQAIGGRAGARGASRGGSKAARRETAAAEAATVASLPDRAGVDYLDAYPAVKHLMQRFK